ncbi:MAG: hypothetical protein PHW69_07725 [Elusimicrobiaceae bacterium]|nr:hypothetical protein [Elusimicrobiaceae bacterium]
MRKFLASSMSVCLLFGQIAPVFASVPEMKDGAAVSSGAADKTEMVAVSSPAPSLAMGAPLSNPDIAVLRTASALITPETGQKLDPYLEKAGKDGVKLSERGQRLLLLSLLTVMPEDNARLKALATGGQSAGGADFFLRAAAMLAPSLKGDVSGLVERAPSGGFVVTEKGRGLLLQVLAAGARLDKTLVRDMTEGVEIKNFEMPALVAAARYLSPEKPDSFYQRNGKGRVRLSAAGRRALLQWLVSDRAAGTEADAVSAKRRLLSALAGYAGLRGSLPKVPSLGDIDKPVRRAPASIRWPDSAAGAVKAGVAAGVAAGYLNFALAGTTYLHEAAHVAAVKSIDPAAKTSITIQRTENLKAFVKNPSAETLYDAVTMRGLSDAKSGGVTKWSPTADYTDAQRAYISAAGPAVESVVGAGEFAVGFKLRKKHPVAGYALMTAGVITELSPVCYALSALDETLAVKYIGSGAASSGNIGSTHDFLNIAARTGIPTMVTATAVASILPATALALYAGELISEKKSRQHAVLARLVSDGRLGETELDSLFDGYSRRRQLETAKTEREMRRESAKFQDYLLKEKRDLITRNLDLVDKPRRRSFREVIHAETEAFRAEFSKNKTGLIMNAAAMGSGMASGAAVNLSSLGMTALAGVAEVLVPGAAVVGTAANIYNLVRVGKNRNMGKVDRSLAVVQAVSGIAMSAGMVIPVAGMAVVVAGTVANVSATAARFLYSRYAKIPVTPASAPEVRQAFLGGAPAGQPAC